MQRKTGFIFTATLLAVILPAPLFAGGLKEKLQNKLSVNSQSNIQYDYSLGECAQAGISGTCFNQYLAGAGSQESAKRVVAEKDLTLSEGAYPKEKESSEQKSYRRCFPQPILSSYAIYKTEYKAELDEDVATIKGRAIFEVFGKGLIRYLW
ncbi:MAG: hypothetical protein NC923_06460 [Candidatus Omnitrophica bacterium]|nr:hypothetical protein [Candidatus Omnitrophota bacterium]